jgi:hypothetical protein
MSRQLQLKQTGPILLVLAMMVLAASGTTLAADKNDPNELSGGWAITITLDPNPVLPTTVHVFGNFTSDGNFIFSDSIGTYGAILSPPYPAPFTQSPGHGQWERTGRGQFILDSWHIVFDNTGKYFGVSRGQARIQYNPKTDTITGSNFLQLIPDSTVSPLPPLPGLNGTISGKRLKIEPPPSTP